MGTVAIGSFRHVVTFQTLTAVSDGDGGTVQDWVDLLPAWNVAIQPATVRDLERVTAGTVVASATHVITGRYRPDVDIDDRMMFAGREFRIKGLANPDERGLTMTLFAVETI